MELAVLHLINVGIVMQEFKKSFPMGCLGFRMVGNGLRVGKGANTKRPLPARPFLNFPKPRVTPDAFPARVELEPTEPFITFVRRDIEP